MTKIDGKYQQKWTDDLLEQISKEDSITKRHRLITQYINQRCKQVEKIIANFEDDDVDLEMVVEQLWEDLKLVRTHFSDTAGRISNYYKSNNYLCMECHRFHRMK